MQAAAEANHSANECSAHGLNALTATMQLILFCYGYCSVLPRILRTTKPPQTASGSKTLEKKSAWETPCNRATRLSFRRAPDRLGSAGDRPRRKSALTIYISHSYSPAAFASPRPIFSALPTMTCISSLEKDSSA